MKEKLLKYRSVGILVGICAVLVLAIILIMGKNPLYGSYKATKLLYYSPLAHEDADTFTDSFKQIVLSKEEFVVECAEPKVSVAKPKFKEAEMTADLAEKFSTAMWGENPVSTDKVQKVYDIVNKEGETSNHMLWETTDGMLLVKYYVINDSMDIWYVVAIEK